MSTGATSDRRTQNRGAIRAVSVGGIALIVCTIGALFDPGQFFRSYLASYLFYQGIALGCLAILMTSYVTGGAWGFLIRRFLEAGTRTLPLLAILMIPVGCGLWYLFPWARPEEVAANPKLHWRQIYLNVPFWWGRAVLFFAVFLALAYLLNSWSRRLDETGDERYSRRLELWSGPGLVAYGICMHFAAVDWLMSIQSEFRSSVFGPLIASGHFVTGLAVVLIALAWFARHEAIERVISTKVLNDLGSLFFAFLVIWAYIVFFQFMLIWMANLPLEVVWYLERSRNGWQWVAWILFVGHFVVPFFALLMRTVKRDAAAMAVVAGLLLVMHLMFLDWQVLPAYSTSSLVEHWMDVIMPIGLGGLWLGNYLWELGRRPPVPVRDPNREHALELRHEDLVEAELEEAFASG